MIARNLSARFSIVRRATGKLFDAHASDHCHVCILFYSSIQLGIDPGKTWPALETGGLIPVVTWPTTKAWRGDLMLKTISASAMTIILKSSRLLPPLVPWKERLQESSARFFHHKASYRNFPSAMSRLTTSWLALPNRAVIADVMMHVGPRITSRSKMVTTQRPPEERSGGEREDDRGARPSTFQSTAGQVQRERAGFFGAWRNIGRKRNRKVRVLIVLAQCRQRENGQAIHDWWRMTGPMLNELPHGNQPGRELRAFVLSTGRITRFWTIK